MLNARLDAGAGRIDAAMKQLDEVLARTPGLEGAGLLKGEILRQARNDADGALALFRQVRKAHPRSLPAHVAVISMLLQQNKAADARTDFAALQKLNPGHPDTLFIQARLALADKDFKGSREITERLLSQSPDNVRVLMLAGAAEMGQQRNTLASGLFGRALKATPDDSRLRTAVAVAQLARGDNAPAVAQLESIAQGDRGAQADLALIAARMQQNDLPAGDSQRAVSTYKRLAALQPRNPLHLARLDDASLAGKDMAGASAALKQALEVQPDHLMSQRGLALLAQMDRRPQDAIAIARSIQQRLPKDAVGHALEAELEGRNGNGAGAAAAYAAAPQRNPNPDIAMRTHAALMRAGKTADADHMAADWQKAHPKDAAFLDHLGDLAAAMNNIAFILAAQRKPGAVAMAEQALAILPDRATLLDTLSIAQEAENQLGRALDTRKRAAELDPRNPMLRLAQLHQKKGNKSEARDLLEPLARLGPSFNGQAELGSLLKQL